MLSQSPQDTVVLYNRNAILNDVRECSRILLNNPRDIDTLSKRAMLYKKLDDTKSFLRDLQTAKDYRTEENIFYTWYYEQLRDYPKKEMLVSQAFATLLATDDVTAKPSNGAVAHSFAGRNALNNKQYQSSIEHFTAALNLFDVDFISQTNRGIANRYLGNKTEALEDLNYVINMYYYSRAYYARGMFFLHEGQVHKAQADLMNSIKRADRSDFIALNANKEAILRVLSTDKSSPIAPPLSLEKFTAEIKSLLATEAYGRVLVVTTIAIQQYPLHIDFYVARGYAFTKIYCYESAELDYSIALWLGNPNDFSHYYLQRSIIHLHSENIRYATHDIDSAYACLLRQTFRDEHAKSQAIDALFTEFSQQCAIIGKEAVSRGGYETAKFYFEEALSRKSTPELLLDYADILVREESYVTAFHVVNKAINMSLNNPKFYNKVVAFRKTLAPYLDRDARKLKALTQPPQEKPILSSSEETAETVSPIKKKKPQKQPTKKIFFQARTNPPAIPSAYGQQIETESNNDAWRLQELDLIQKEKQEHERLRKEKAKEKAKEKKEEKLQLRQKKNALRKFDETEVETEEETSPASKVDISAAACANQDNPHTFFSPKASSTPTNKEEIPTTISIDLLPIEKKLFEKFAAYTSDNKNSESYVLYVVGGSVFDRVRKKLLNHSYAEGTDCDLVTNLPCPVILTLFADLNIQPSHHIDGLFRIHTQGISIDIMYSNKLSNLVQDALARDFCPLYLDAQGNVLDPTDRGISSLLKGYLESPLSSSQLFNDDPTRILRAIYQSSKRDLTLPNTLIKHIKKRKDLLLQLTPEKLNFWINKLLSGGMTSKTYTKLRDLQILDVLFPNIVKDLEEDHAWILEQMKKTDVFPHPRLQRIFASLVVSSAMPKFTKTGTFKENLTPMLEHCKQTIAQTSLLKSAFSEQDSIMSDFVPALSSWCKAHHRFEEKSTQSSDVIALDHHTRLKP